MACPKYKQLRIVCVYKVSDARRPIDAPAQEL